MDRLSEEERQAAGIGEWDFPGGLGAARALHVQERERVVGARARLRQMILERNSDQAEFERAQDEAVPAAPLWQRVCGFGPREELLIDVGLRRAGIRKLLRVVETLFRAEWKTVDEDAVGGAFPLDTGEVSYAGRSVLWDPLNEICVYLAISKTKLNALSLQRTGLRAQEMCDCIRAEKLKGHLRAMLRPLARTWREHAAGTITALADGWRQDVANLAWAFLKWVRGGGRGETRKKLAFEMGMTSRERLDRAVLASSGETLEAVEVEIAAEVLRELLDVNDVGVATGDDGAHGAGCDEVAGQERVRRGGPIIRRAGRETA